MEALGGESFRLDALRDAALDGHPEGALGWGKMYCSTKYLHSKTQRNQQKHWGPRTVRDEPPLSQADKRGAAPPTGILPQDPPSCHGL